MLFILSSNQLILFSGPSYSLYTVPEMFNSGWFYPLGHSFEFSLQGCQSAKIQFAATPFKQDSEGFTIILGDVSKITNYQGDTELISVSTPNLLHCLALRKYWISWADGLRVGTGKVNFNQILEHRDPNQINLVALSLQTSSTQSTELEWLINKRSGT